MRNEDEKIRINFLTIKTLDYWVSFLQVEEENLSINLMDQLVTKRINRQTKYKN